MSEHHTPPSKLHRRHALAALVASAASPWLLSACGGGGGDEPPAGGSAAPQGYMSGPISGLGSIIVGGVRFDDSGARVEDEDGASRGRGELKLGMMVEIQSSSIDDNAARAVALLIRFGSELKGPVASVDAATQTFRMLDQTVEVRATTVFDSRLAGGFAALAVGQILEVHALFDAATGRYSATRIELEDNASEYRLRGVISALDSAAKTFRVGDAVINYAGVVELPSLANGQRVRVRLQTAQVNGQWVATRVRSGVGRPDDGIADARIRGLITAFTSPQAFEVNGIRVDASAARFEPSAGAVVLGAMVEVRGRADNGAIVATRVKVIDRDRDDDFKRVELHGTMSALDITAKTFVLREVTVDYSRVVIWDDGREADLANGKALEVKGLWSVDRRVLNAIEIEFE
jgi:Domain of unknown function (DUF5666)